MTLVHFKFTKPSPTGRVPATGTVRFAPSRLLVLADVDGTVVMPSEFSLTVPETGVMSVQLDPTSAGWAWTVQVFGFDGVTAFTDYLLVPDQVEANYSALVKVNPKSLEPIALPEAAWWAELEATKTLAGDVQAARTEAVAAAAAAKAVGDTNDAIVTGLLQTPTSQFAPAIDGSITAAISEGGAARNELNAAIGDSVEVGGVARPTIDAAVDAGSKLVIAGQIAASEATRARVQDLRQRVALTTDNRVRTTLVTGQPDQSYIPVNCTMTADTARFLEGAQSQRFTTTGAVTATVVLDPLFPPAAPDPFVFAKASIVRMLVWIDDPSKVTTFNLEIYDQSGLTGQWIRGNANFHKPLTQGWNLLSWKAAAGSSTAWGTVYRVRFVTITTGATSWNVQSVWVESQPKAQILFIEDRGYKTFVDSGLPDLRARKIPVTWALDPALHGTALGTKGEVITDAQVAQFYSEGDDMSIHAYDGAVTSTMTPAQIREDTLKSHQWLQDRGYTRGREWRAAWTQNNAPNHAAAQAYYAAYATPSGTASDETWPFINPWNVSRVNLHGLTTTSMDGFFATLQKTNCLMVCYTHGIHADGGSDMTPTLWAHFMAKIDEGIAGGWLEGVTFSQLLANSGGVLRT